MRISAIIPDVKDMNQRVTDLPRGNGSEALSGSLFRDALAKFYTSLRHLSTPSLLLVITIAVILVLMQVNIHGWNLSHASINLRKLLYEK